MSHRIDVITTSISGSISDWRKVERIVPLFQARGETDTHLHVAGSHQAARTMACDLARTGSTILISAGGSGTFNSVVEGCHDAGINLDAMRLGFLRKGSADLIGKALGMPDQIEDAVTVFVEAIRQNRTVPCDVLMATSTEGSEAPRRFVGYGGAEIFGDIPYYTENRFIKYYKGIFGQLLGDLGPFAVGTSLAVLRRLFRPRSTARRRWRIAVDDQAVAEGRFQALIIVNGDLGPNLPYAKGVPLGSGDFHLFAISNLGLQRLPGQLRAAWNSSILRAPDKWGLQSFRCTRSLVLQPEPDLSFPLNTDGSTLICRGGARIEIVGRIHLFTR